MAKQSKFRNKKRWEEVLRAWKRSGLSGSAYCRKSRISPPSFYAWKRRLAGPQSPVVRGRQAFLPVSVVTAGGETHPVVELTLLNGRVLRLYREMPAPALAELVRALEEKAC
jgi:hypothetical protein